MNQFMEVLPRAMVWVLLGTFALAAYVGARQAAQRFFFLKKDEENNKE